MRIALISTIGEEGRADNPALMQIAGRSVARRQLDLAVVLGCERIVCLADGPGPEIVRLQHAADAAGSRFNAVTGARALTGLVGATDELLVLAPRLLPDPDPIAGALGERRGVLVIAAEAGTAMHFERIDREHAWAGAMLIAGSAVERLGDLPPDSEPASSLLRIALQSGVQRIELPADVLDQGVLSVIDGAEARDRTERNWITRNGPRPDWRKPGSALLARAIEAFAPSLLAFERAAPVANAIGAASLVGAGVAASFGRSAVSLAILTLAAALLATGQAVGRLVRGANPRFSRWSGVDMAVDATFVASAVLAKPGEMWVVGFSAAMAILAMRLLAGDPHNSRLAGAADRLTVYPALAVAAALGYFMPAVQILGLLVLAIAMYTRSQVQLTQV